MLQIENLSLYFGERPLFDGISATINPGERIGLVGPNGAGKSTLLKMIAGEVQPDSGSVAMSNRETTGYLPQDGVDPQPGTTVYSEVERVFEKILNLREESKELQRKMERLNPGSDEHDQVLKRFGLVQHQLEDSGDYTLKSEIERVLSGLGFRESDFNRPTREFSGGWLMRIALARLLLTEPDYLLLDEPTNHLDIESLQWIEQFLTQYQGAVIVVSHDRSFLNTVTNRTLALHKGSMLDYAGNYTYYEKRFAEELEMLKKRAENQQKELQQTQAFIERFRYKATKAKQVQSRIKQIEKMDKIVYQQDQAGEISFRFPPPARSGQRVMTLSGIVKKYDQNIIFDGIDYEIERGDKLAVVGPNGAGKSTLIRILAGIEPFQAGIRDVGYNVTSGYFAQHQAEELSPQNSVLEELRLAGSNESETRLRTLLGCFLFIGDDAFKKVQVLSGGEKSRLALAKMLLSPGNFLIFDEPTNHLDMQSKEILQQALQQFEGTLMIVSHDRDFLDPIVNKTVEVQPGRIKTWLGNVTWYLEKRREEQLQLESVQSQEPTDRGPSRKEQRRLEAERRNELSKKLKPLKKRLTETEASIEKHELRKGEIESLMAESSFYEDSERVKEVSLEYESIKQELASLLNKWEELAGRIEYIESESLAD